MTRGLNFRLNDLPDAMRRQAQAKLDAVGTVRTHVCEDDPPKVGRPKKRTWRAPTVPKLNTAEERLALHMRAEGLNFQREFRFSRKRFWRFDFAHLPAKLAVEIDGGVYSGGRHVRGKGFENDAEKLNAAVIEGWRVLRYLPSHVKSGRAIREIKRALESFRT